MSERYATTLEEVLALRSENAQLREQLANANLVAKHETLVAQAGVEEIERLREQLADAEMVRDEWCSEYTAVRDQLAKRTDALKAAQSVLQVLVTPGNEKISSLHIWSQAVAAETGARIALTDDLRKRPEKCPNGLEHGACLYPECVASCPGRLSVTSAQ